MKYQTINKPKKIKDTCRKCKQPITMIMNTDGFLPYFTTMPFCDKCRNYWEDHPELKKQYKCLNDFMYNKPIIKK